MTNLIKQSL